MDIQPDIVCYIVVSEFNSIQRIAPIHVDFELLKRFKTQRYNVLRVSKYTGTVQELRQCIGDDNVFEWLEIGSY